MFDPDLWRRTRTSSIALIVLGAVLLAPAGYVFFLTGKLLSLGQIEMATRLPHSRLPFLRFPDQSGASGRFT